MLDVAVVAQTPDRGRRRRAAGLLAVLFAAAIAAACMLTPAAEAAPMKRTVKVLDDTYTPTRAVIAKGGTVTWRWAGRKRHDVIGNGFRSNLQKTGTFAKRFNRTGTFSYFCSLHAGMQGKVIVVN